MNVKKAVGIKDLKDHASEYINEVIQSQTPLVIKKRDRAVAKIVPIERDELSPLEDVGLLVKRPSLQWKEVELVETGVESANEALAGISSDREER